MIKLAGFAGRGLRVRVKGYAVDFETGRVLRAAALSVDSRICEIIKVRETLRLLLKRGTFYRALLLGKEKKRRLALALLAELGGDGGEKGGKKLVDFERDFAFIYAAFRSAYGIDLAREKLDFRLFTALLSALPEGTRLGEIMRIRAVEIPAQTAYNADYVRRLTALKNAYHTGGGDFQSELGRLFARMTAGGKGNAKDESLRKRGILPEG